MSLGNYLFKHGTAAVVEDCLNYTRNVTKYLLLHTIQLRNIITIPNTSKS
jgi:hypothetical protein